MPYAIVNGIRMHYETHGAGDPVLLIIEEAQGFDCAALGFLAGVKK